MLITLMLAGGANSSPEQIRLLKWLMLGMTVVGILSLAGGILLIVKAHPVWGGVVGSVPVVGFLALMIYAAIPTR